MSIILLFLLCFLQAYCAMGCSTCYSFQRQWFAWKYNKKVISYRIDQDFPVSFIHCINEAIDYLNKLFDNQITFINVSTSADIFFRYNDHINSFDKNIIATCANQIDTSKKQNTDICIYLRWFNGTDIFRMNVVVHEVIHALIGNEHSVGFESIMHSCIHSGDYDYNSCMKQLCECEKDEIETKYDIRL